MANRKLQNRSFLEALDAIAQQAKAHDVISLRQIFSYLSGKGYAALLIVLSLPFCLPVQIPGFSTPFGLLLCFLGLRIAFAKRLWWPKWALEKTFSSCHVQKVCRGAIKVTKKLQKVLRPRLQILVNNRFSHFLNGLLVFFLSLLLSLPLPIPMTNLLSAFPVLFIGFGLLEDDGLALLIGYVLAGICFTSFVALFFFVEKIA